MSPLVSFELLHGGRYYHPGSRMRNGASCNRITLLGFWSIVEAVFARGVVTRVAPEMKDQDIHEQHFPNKIREIPRGWNVSRYFSSLE